MNFHQCFTSVRGMKRLLISLAVMLGASQQLWPQSPHHPLDGLTAPEIWSAYEALQASKKVDEETRYPMVQLKEPPKEEVLAWKPGQAMRREAFIVVRKGAQTFEAVVDVNGRKLLSWTERKGVQPNFTDEERLGFDGPVKENPEVRAALKRRGITNLGTVACGPYASDYFGAAQGSGRRLFHVGCWQEYGPDQDWGSIEGLTIVWDEDAKKVASVKDSSDIVPVPRPPSNYDLASVGPLRDVPPPLIVQQPMGPGFRVDGQSVGWQKWNFHFRLDRRVGLIVDSVGYQDGDKLRSILYEGSLSEIFMAYMDPSDNWYPRTFFDAGEDGNAFLSSLEPGEDCPENAIYFDQIFADWKGLPVRKPRTACLFEQPAGYMAWRHDGGGPVESRKLRQLVLRSIAGVDNYDYVFDWIFQQDGTIRVRVGATGLDNVKAVKSPTAAQDPSGEASQYGRFIAENTVGVNHDHFFSFRLDFDVDGTANSFVRDKLQVQRLPPDGLRKSVWVAIPETAKTEDEAKARLSMEHPESWRIINPNVRNYLGYPVGYQLVAGENAMSLMVPDDHPQQRAGFIDYHVWVTPYRENERYAAGDYPMQGKVGDGLPAWTKANRAIENTDIVLWYTVGFHHVPHAEDWPVMPTVWHEFEMRPVNFFGRNPAVDLPK